MFSLALAGCTHAPIDLGSPLVLNDKDFVYTLASDPQDDKVAFSHLGGKAFQVGVWALGDAPHPLADWNVNHYQFDVESLDFSPDGKTVVTASRDGQLRFFDADTGAPRGGYLTEEPLVSVAFDPAGHFVIAGSAKGLLTLVRFPELTFASELRAHQGEVRALALTADGRLFSGGWDKTLASFAVKPEQARADSARVHFERRGAFSVIHGTLDGKAPVAFTLDARSPGIAVTREVAQSVGIDAALLKDEVTLDTPMGKTVARVARDQTIGFKSLEATGVNVEICDACVPPGVQGVLGKPFTERFDVAFDEVAQEAIINARAAPSGPARVGWRLEPLKRFTFDGYVNDLSIDAAGKRLGVAFSEVKAERNREIYEREKKGVVEPIRDGDAAAIVDAGTGAILAKWSVHHGVVSTAGISPDGQLLASGGWDKQVILNRAPNPLPLAQREFGWSVRRVRFSHDGRSLLVGAWTPQNPLGDQHSAPSAVVYPVRRATRRVE